MEALIGWALLLLAAVGGGVVMHMIDCRRARCPYKCVSCSIRASLGRLAR